MGFNDSAYLAGQATLEEDVALQHGAGSTLWRLPLSWSTAEPSQGEFDFSQTDPVYCAAVEAGIQPVMVLSDSPAWAADTSRPCPDSCVWPPTQEHDADLQRFAEAAAIRYPHAAAIEAWNEPNLHQYWADPDPADYVEVLRAIYQGIKDGNPSMTVLGGGFSNQQTDDPVTGNLSETTFLTGMYEAGAGSYMDALSVHPYPVYPLDDPRELFSPTMAAVRDIAAQYEGRGRRRLWVTELGAVTPPVGPTGFPFTPEQQASTLLGIYKRLNRAPDVDAVIFHTVIEPTAAIPGPPGFGWVLPRDAAGDFYPKPAYCAFAALLAHPIDCTQPVPVP